MIDFEMLNFEQGISAIDTGFFRPRFDASHLIVERGRAAFVDVGTNHSVPLLLAALKEKNVPAESVDYVILTHVHLDHAGGAGALIRHLPNARLVVHPRGARTCWIPANSSPVRRRCMAPKKSSAAYGELLPVDAARVDIANDGYVIDLAGRELVCLDTPGHARHHMSIYDARSRAFFPGDTFGLSYREFDTDKGAFILPTTTPVQFEPEALHASIERMLGYAPEQMFLTHYSRVTDVSRLARDLHEQIDAMVAIARKHADDPQRHERIMADLADLYTSRAHAHGCALSAAQVHELLAMDIELNAQGLEVWLDRQRQA